jgi:hypothetical protein
MEMGGMVGNDIAPRTIRTSLEWLNTPCGCVGVYFTGTSMTKESNAELEWINSTAAV